MKKLLFCFGTRPEAIKMAPIIKETLKRGHQAVVCLSGQHKEMLTPFMEFFSLESHHNLEVMSPNQTLATLTAKIITGTNEVILKEKPDCIIVQGDTTTTFASALAGFYNKIPVAHVEAGLRTNDIYSPFPEEANRKLVTAFAQYFFPPTSISANNLAKEGIEKNVYVTGNTSIDALRVTQEIIQDKNLDEKLYKKYPFVKEGKKLVLITVHRRENHGEPLKRICAAIKHISKNKDIEVAIPVHLNPNVQEVVNNTLGKIDNINLLPPLEYLDFSWLMSKSFMILTDSGGVQEEAPYFKKPILVLRRSTERPEGVDVNVAKLVGDDTELIISEVDKILNDQNYYNSFSTNQNPYGDGHASSKIIEVLEKNL